MSEDNATMQIKWDGSFSIGSLAAIIVTIISVSSGMVFTYSGVQQQIKQNSEAIEGIRNKMVDVRQNQADAYKQLSMQMQGMQDEVHSLLEFELNQSKNIQRSSFEKAADNATSHADKI